MNTESQVIIVQGLQVEVIRKDIKNLHLAVYPPNGRVRIAVPLHVNDAAVRLAVINKLRWIKTRRERFEAQPRQSEREMSQGESHYFLGARYRLRIVGGAGETGIVKGEKRLELHEKSPKTQAQRDRILQEWYRERLKELVPGFLEKWEKKLGVQVKAWGIRKMKTRWGSCNPFSGRILLNLELIKTPVECLEYIVVHELLHLRERLHNDRFLKLMNRYLPQWRFLRDELNRSPLGHVNWEY